ncbi:39S ribosomal protein L46, mitochondrial, partial [Tanacetum coccineum]
MLPVVFQICRFAPQLHESAGGLPSSRNLCRIHAPWQGARVQWKFQFPLHSCSLAGSTSAMKVSNWGGHLHFREVEERRRKVAGEYKQKKMKQKEQECHISSRFWLGRNLKNEPTRRMSNGVLWKLKRALDRRLYLLIYGHAYDTPKGQPVWHLPEKVYSSKETLCKCVESESALQSFIGDLSNTYFVVNAPMGHIASKLTEKNENLSYFT